MLETVYVTGLRSDPDTWAAWQWNSQADKWLNMDDGQLYAPGAKESAVVRGWSPVPKMANNGAGTAYGLADLLGQANLAKATENSWSVNRVTRDLRTPSAHQIADYQRNGRLTQTMGPVAPLPWRDSVMQQMRDSAIGQNPVGRAYLGAVDFTTALPGQAWDTAKGIAHAMTFQGQMELSMVLSRTIEERGVLGAGAYAMSSSVDGLQEWYRQAYFGDEEDATRAILQAGLFVGPTKFGRVGGVAESGRIAFASTEAVTVSGSRAIDLGKTYEVGVRNLYGDVPFGQRQYEALVGGKWVDGVADNVVQIGGNNTAIEAKFVDDWATSLRNPASPQGAKPWAVGEQSKMVDQAMKYNAAFDQVIYHTNSIDLANYYSRAFGQAGANNFRFVITPAVR